MTFTEYITCALAVIFAALWIYESVEHTKTRAKLEKCRQTRITRLDKRRL